MFLATILNLFNHITCMVSNEAQKTIPGALALFDVKIHRTPAPARLKIKDNDSLWGVEWLAEEIKSGSSDMPRKNTKDFVSCNKNRATADKAAIKLPIPNVICEVVAWSRTLSIKKGPTESPKNKPPVKIRFTAFKCSPEHAEQGTPSTKPKRRDREDGELRSAAHL